MASPIAQLVDLTVFGAAQINPIIDRVNQFIVCTSSTRPAAPSTGWHIFETDTGRLYLWNGAAWKYVANIVGEEFASLQYVPGGNVDATTSGTLADWLSPGNVTVPAWATKARFQATLTGHFAITAGANSYVAKPTIGGQGPASVGQLVDPGSGIRFQMSWTNLITLSGSGVQAVKIQAARQAGTGAWRADAVTVLGVNVEFIP